MDRELLRWVKRFAGERGGAVLLAVGAAVIVPLAIDVARNVRRTHRDWREGGVDPLGGDTTHEVPVPTPRRFREGDGEPLTRREKTIVAHGQLALGEVVHHGPLTSVRYEAPWGATITSRPVEVEPRPRDGASAVLVFEPGARVGVAPALHRVVFDAAVTKDGRPAKVAGREAKGGAWQAQVHATLHPVERFAHTGDTTVGELRLEASRLRMRLGDVQRELRLDRPFTVVLTCQPLPADRVELCVELTPKEGGGYRATEADAWRIKTELPQRRVAASVAVAWRDGGYLAAHDFERLWGALLAHADQPELSWQVG